MGVLIGLILAAGSGTRILSEFDCSSKSLIKINGKPVIEHVLSYAAGVEKIYIVVAGSGIENVVGADYNGVPVEYIEQTRPEGTACAIECAKDKLNDDVLLLLGDEIFQNIDVAAMKEFFLAQNCDCVIGVTQGEPEELIRKNYAVEHDAGVVTKLDEKPDKTFNSLKGTGLCIFKPEMLRYLQSLDKTEKTGQYELTGWLNAVVAAGKICRIFPVAQKEFNINSYEDYAAACKETE